MQNLIALILKYGGFFSFLFLEAVCFFMIVQFNERQSDIYFNTFDIVSGKVNDQREGLVRFWNMSSVADSLARENALLKAQMEEYKLRRSLRQDTIVDEAYQQKYVYVPARVISNSVNLRNNYMMLDRGKANGIEPGMGVIGSTGLVGIVRDVSQYYCWVMSLLHKETRISAAIRRNGYFGSLVWKGNDPTNMLLTNIPKHATIQVGDTIQSSGYSLKFPAGIMVGKVENFNRESGSNIYNVDVSLHNDLSNLSYAYIVKNLVKADQAQLVEGGQNE